MVVIPEERYSIVDFRQEALPGVAVINHSLVDFEPKIVFRWHLSVMLQCEELAQKGMPAKSEQKAIDDYGDTLDAVFKGADPEKPNSLFLARITWNATRELIYRVYDPEPIHQYLQRTITEKTHSRHFDYRMGDDPEWKLAEWHLNATKKA